MKKDEEIETTLGPILVSPPKKHYDLSQETQNPTAKAPAPAPVPNPISQMDVGRGSDSKLVCDKVWRNFIFVLIQIWNFLFCEKKQKIFNFLNLLESIATSDGIQSTFILIDVFLVLISENHQNNRKRQNLF